MEQLTVGNIVTISINLYRKNFKQYLKLSFIAHLWLIIPIYGWGKYLEIAADISYESFKNLFMYQFPNYKLIKVTCSFLHFKYLLSFSLKFLNCLGSISLFLYIPPKALFFTISLILNDSFQNSFFYQLLDFIVGLTAFSCIIFAFIFSYLFMTDLVLNKEQNKNTFKLTSGSISIINRFSLKILAIILSFIITIPLMIISFSIIYFITWFFIPIIPQWILIKSDSVPIVWICISIWFLFLSFVTMPFLQSVKAAVYYRIFCEEKAFYLTI